MKVDREEAGRIAALANLAFDEHGLDRMAAEMTAILSYIDQLAEVNVEGFEEDAQLPSMMRPDEVGASTDRQTIAENAPAWNDNYFVVPRTVGGE